jgi:hypothetical protein
LNFTCFWYAFIVVGVICKNLWTRGSLWIFKKFDNNGKCLRKHKTFVLGILKSFKIDFSIFYLIKNYKVFYFPSESCKFFQPRFHHFKRKIPQHFGVNPSERVRARFTKCIWEENLNWISILQRREKNNILTRWRLVLMVL